MKVKDLFEAPVKGNWKIANLTGWEKTFQDEDSPEAQAWMRNRDPKPVKTSSAAALQKKWDKEDRAAEREAAKRKKAARPTDDQIMDKADDAFAYAMDGGDPIDCIGKWMERTGIEMSDIDKVVNKRHKTKKGFYGVLAMMWDDMQGDQIHDAKLDLKQNRKPDDNSQFFRVVNGEIKPSSNPWKGN